MVVVAASAQRVRAVTRWLIPADALRRLLGVEAGLAVAALLTSGSVRRIVELTMAAIAIGVMARGIRHRQPAAVAGWWTLLASAAATTIAAAGELLPRAVGLSYGLFALTHVLMIVGLALIGRRAGRRRGCVDLLDAAMAAAALFPLLWVLVIAPALSAGTVPIAVALAYPFAGLLALLLAVRLVLATGSRHPATIGLLVAAGALLAVNICVLVHPVPFDTSLPLLWVTQPVALAVAVLWPGAVDLPSARRRSGPDAALYSSAARVDTALTVPRLVSLAVLATAVPLVCVIAYYQKRGSGLTWADYNALAFLGPLVVVAFLLVGRLIVIARVAQQRAGELGHQARALAEAVEAQEALRRQLIYRARHDPLTGLPNRMVFAERLDWALSRRTGSQRHALILLDLDGFKGVNDDFGHPVGDEVLIATAHRLLSVVPQGGTVARMAGDEFAVLLEDIEPEQANAVAQHILSAIRRPFDVSAGQAVVTASVGLLLVDTVASQTTVSAALRDADLALATAKRSGKDRVLTFTAAMRQSRLGHSRMIAGLRRALTSGELSVHYQPIVDLATQRIQAVEALVRWMPPDGPPVPPSEFIPVAEESGLIRDIGEWVLRRACQDARAWYTRSGVAVSVNVSGRQLVDPGFAELVIDALTDAGLPGSALIVELTETSLIATATVATAAAQLGKVRQRGVRVAIDDFGTGYSSLSYLAQLPVDILKIDRSFTRHGERIDFGPDEWPFARAIIALGHGLKLTTVAEGIETVEQARALRELRCQLAQGHLFSWPLPPAGIDALLASDAPLPRGGQLDTSSHVPGMSPGVTPPAAAPPAVAVSPTTAPRSAMAEMGNPLPGGV